MASARDGGGCLRLSSSPRKNPASNPEAIALIAIYESGNGAAWASNDGWNLTPARQSHPASGNTTIPAARRGASEIASIRMATCSSGRVEALEFETVNHDGMISGTPFSQEIGLLSNTEH